MRAETNVAVELSSRDHLDPLPRLSEPSPSRSFVKWRLLKWMLKALWSKRLHGLCSTKKSTFEVSFAIHNQSADHTYQYSADGRRVYSAVNNVAPRKHARLEPDDEPEEYADWVDVPDSDTTQFAAVASTLTSDEGYFHQIQEGEARGDKRARYISSDNPMQLWREVMPDFLDAMICQDGLGMSPSCGTCGLSAASGRLFRCQDCDHSVQCEECLRAHQRTPLHCIQEWTGEFWVSAALHRLHINDTSPQSLRETYQLGHHGGACPLPATVDTRTMVVLDVGGIFTLDVCFCGCSNSLQNNHIAQLMGNHWYPATTLEPGTCATWRVLELFRQLNVVGNINAHDFVRSLEKLNDPTMMNQTPDRYVAFGRMARQYQFLKRAKRSGLAHVEEGFKNVEAGKLAVPCWACPKPGFNLPDGWDKCSEDDRFLYSLLLALDANFRLKNRLRTNEKQDASLGPGWGYFVEGNAYKEHLRDYVAEEDVSTCIAFAALMQKETRLTTGLRISGVGGCVCARHGVVRAQGMGDLQKGERYANMDYIFLHALGDTRVKRLVLSYDIACQWKQRLRERALTILSNAQVVCPTTGLTVDKVPNLTDYEIKFAAGLACGRTQTGCQATHSLSYAWGVGRTDGEGIERTWALLNPIGFSTKEMGEGNRLDTIEDRIDHLNFEKNVRQGDVLARKLIIAVAERDTQIKQFKRVDDSLEPGVRKDWQKMVENWLVDNTQPNPYLIGANGDGPSEAKVAAQLKAAEVAEAREQRGEFVDGKITAAAFVKGLLHLEDLKMRYALAASLPERASQIEELRVSFFKKLHAIQQQQEIYMSGVGGLRRLDEERRDTDQPPQKAEDVKLWLPSELGDRQKWACRKGLFELEAKLRQAQCGDALTKVRSLLYAKTHLIFHRNAASVGQNSTTRSATLIGRMVEKITREATKYRQAWVALRRLKGDDFAPEYRKLEDSDLNVGWGRPGLPEMSRRPRRPGLSLGFGSWREGDEEVRIHDAVRVQWAKARARRDRWTEEVLLIREEMRRVLRSLWSIQQQWLERETSRPNARPGVARGPCGLC
ncbi:CxC2 domain-containing protein [Mycena indigotica]|uniref:CxC2 domain-containing protein n=1 Tax=Mycena indigotica TaxID=2126181 RepID=A0A8H6WCB3_9AGAR|nr:CxC2 domain-containing protein [Mycena indigotica]KAF7312647.1 CxC2 domain-containing protein [Mycena indigotica]